MKNPLSRKPARKPRAPQFQMTPAMKARMEKAMASIGSIADKQARNDDRIQREARMAIADTFDAWIGWLEATAPERVEEIFFELGCLATTTNRRRLFKHTKAPEGIAERVQAQLDGWKAEEDAEKPAGAEASTSETGAETS